MFDEDDLIPISSIQHFMFCERRAALVFIEQMWKDNVATTEGSRLHAKTESGKPEWVDGVLITRSLTVRSLKLGLIGITDVVEFHPCTNELQETYGIPLQNQSGTWLLYPVEYKREKLRHEQGFIQQLCAQAMCLEEMLNTRIEEGSIFYGKTRRRLTVSFEETIRQQTQDTITKLHEMFAAQTTPLATEQPKCKHCSLYDLCSPMSLKSERSLKLYFNKIFQFGDEN